MRVNWQLRTGSFLQRSSPFLTILWLWLCCLPVPEGAAQITPDRPRKSEFNFFQGGTGVPAGWHRDIERIPGVEISRVYPCRVTGQPGNLLALQGGADRQARVWCEVRNIRPATDYLLEFMAYRPRFTNGVYLEVEIFGERQIINQHFSYGQVQRISLRVNSGQTRGTTRLLFQNPHREVLAFGPPSLRKAAAENSEGLESGAVRLPNFFPVGIYNAGPEDLTEIRAAGFNAVQSYDPSAATIRAMASASARLGLKFLPCLPSYAADLSREMGARPEVLGFYIADEPEGRSITPEQLRSLKESLQADHPGVLTALAMLRPQLVASYRQAADVFMIDPYPVPHMPMTWLSDSLEEAAKYVPKERLWAVIQAFGGGNYGKDGWSRRPTNLEMRCLTYLAVSHGAHGLFYFSYPEVRQDPEAWEGLQKITGELQQLRTWLVLSNETSRLHLEMTSPFRADAAGRPAVHFCQKRQGEESLLILVNVLDKPVSFMLHGFPAQVSWLTELMQKKKSVVQEGNIREELGPYEVRLYRFSAGG